MKFKLYYKNKLVGDIEQKSTDFPNLSGTYKISPSVIKENRLILDYIEYSIKSNVLMEENEKEWQDFIIKEEYKYTTLIESNEWSLIDQNKKVHNISIPIFYDKNEILWRWNFTPYHNNPTNNHYFPVCLRKPVIFLNTFFINLITKQY